MNSAIRFPGLLFLCVAFLGGCAASPTVPGFAAVKSQPAVIRWVRPTGVLSSSAVFSRAGDGAVRIQIHGQDAMSPLVSVILTTDERLLVSGSIVRHPWQGAAGDAPPGFVIWVRVAQIYRLAGSWPSGERDLLAGATRSTIRVDDGNVTFLRVASDLDAESVTARLAPAKP